MIDFGEEMKIILKIFIWNQSDSLSRIDGKAILMTLRDDCKNTTILLFSNGTIKASSELWNATIFLDQYIRFPYCGEEKIFTPNKNDILTTMHLKLNIFNKKHKLVNLLISFS